MQIGGQVVCDRAIEDRGRASKMGLKTGFGDGSTKPLLPKYRRERDRPVESGICDVKSGKVPPSR